MAGDRAGKGGRNTELTVIERRLHRNRAKLGKPEYSRDTAFGFADAVVGKFLIKGHLAVRICNRRISAGINGAQKSARAAQRIHFSGRETLVHIDRDIHTADQAADMSGIVHIIGGTHIAGITAVGKSTAVVSGDTAHITVSAHIGVFKMQVGYFSVPAADKTDITVIRLRIIHLAVKKGFIDIQSADGVSCAVDRPLERRIEGADRRPAVESSFRFILPVVKIGIGIQHNVSVKFEVFAREGLPCRRVRGDFRQLLGGLDDIRIGRFPRAGLKTFRGKGDPIDDQITVQNFIFRGFGFFGRFLTENRAYFTLNE